MQRPLHRRFRSYAALTIIAAAFAGFSLPTLADAAPPLPLVAQSLDEAKTLGDRENTLILVDFFSPR